MIAEALKQQADEKRRAERRQRHLQDDLRYALKKLPEPIDLSLSYEDVRVLPEQLTKFTNIRYVGCPSDARATRVQGNRRRRRSTSCVLQIRETAEGLWSVSHSRNTLTAVLLIFC